MKESHGREHGRLAEDEKIREDSNEGLDSSSSNDGGGSSGDAADDDVAFDAATAVYCRPPRYTTIAGTAAMLPKWRRQHCYDHRSADRVFEN